MNLMRGEKSLNRILLFGLIVVVVLNVACSSILCASADNSITCFGESANSPNVCSKGQGNCIGQDVCACFSGYDGPQCSKVLGVLSSRAFFGVDSVAGSPSSGKLTSPRYLSVSQGNLYFQDSKLVKNLNLTSSSLGPISISSGAFTTVMRNGTFFIFSVDASLGSSINRYTFNSNGTVTQTSIFVLLKSNFDSIVYSEANDCLYVMDQTTYRILKITNILGSLAVSTTAVGVGTTGFNGDGPGNTTRLGFVTDLLVVDSDLYFADRTGLIRKFDSQGMVTTISSNVTVVGMPVALAVSPAGDIFFLEYRSKSLKRIEKRGVISTVGTIPGATAGSKMIFSSDSTILIVEPQNYVIREYTLSPFCSDLRFTGYNCDQVNAYCNSIPFNSSNVCSGNGQCISTNTCKCKAGFYGSDCSSIECFGFASNNSLVCSGRGKCINANTCQCNTGSGVNCHLETCYGKRSDESDVCSGNGYCTGTDSCKCFDGFTGSKCEYSFGEPFYTVSNYSMSLSSIMPATIYGNGTHAFFISGTSVKMLSGLTNVVTTLFTASTTVSQVMEYQGSIYYLDGGSLKRYYNGQTNTIFAKFSTPLSFNSGGIIATSPTTPNINNFAISKLGIFIADSTNKKIYRIVEDQFGNRKYIHFAGKDTTDTTFSNGNGYGIDATMGPPSGLMVNDFGDVFFVDQTYFVIRKVNIYDGLISTVAGIPGSKAYVASGVPTSPKATPLSPSTITNLIPHNGGILFDDAGSNIIRKIYKGLLTNVAGIPKVPSMSIMGKDALESPLNILSPLFKINSDILFTESSTNVLHKLSVFYKCAEGFSGSNCLEPLKCNNVAFTDSSVCSGNGKCKQTGCDCNYNWYGSNCEVPTCFNIKGNDPNVCSGRGSCIAQDKCQCTTQGFSGERCTEFSCFSVPRSSPSVCGSKGTCVSPDKCLCYSTMALGFWTGNQCDTCKDPYIGSKCNQVPVTNTCDETATCLGNGKCGDKGCICNGNFNGTNCNICKERYFGASCQSFCESRSTCSGNGYCDPKLGGQCTCNSDSTLGYFTGTNCTVCQDGYYGTNCLTQVLGPATLSNYGNSVTFKLFGPSTRQSIPCSDLFTISILENTRFGANPRCYWTDKSTGNFVIEFGDGYDVTPGSSTIRIRPDVFDLKKVGGEIKLKIDMPENPIKPIAKIAKKKTEFGSCENLVVDGSASFSGDRKPLKFHWSLVSSTAETFDTFAEVLTNQTDSKIIINSDLYPSGTHDIQLIVESTLFGTQSDPDVIKITKGEMALPIIAIAGKNPLVTTRTATPVMVKKSVILPSCLPNNTLVDYNWKLMDTSSSSKIQFLVDSYGNLVISSFQDIGYQNYNFELSASLASDPTSVSKVYFTVTTSPQDLTLKYYLNSMTYDKAIIELVLTDPDNTEQVENWAYSCSAVDASSCGKGVDTFLNSQTSNVQKLVINRADVNATLLEKGSRLTIYVNVTKDSRMTSTQFSIVFPVTEAAIPPVISLLGASPPRVNPTDTIFASLKVYLNGKPVFYPKQSTQVWTLDGSQVGVGSYLAYKTLEEGRTYNFLFSTVVNSVESTYSQTVTVNRVPSCSCFVSPTSGFALDTTFLMSCPNCQNQEQTLDISFGFVDANTRTEVTLYNQGENNFQTALTPQPLSSTRTFISIKDKSTGAGVMKYFDITVVNPVALSLAQVSNKVDYWNSVAANLPEGDPGKLVYNSVSISNAMKYMLSILDPTNANTRSLRSKRAIDCFGHGTIINGKCKCDNGYFTSDCRYTEEDYNVVVKMKKNLFTDFYKTQTRRNTTLETVTEDILTMNIMGLDSFLSDYDYLTNTTLDGSLSLLASLLEESLSKSDLMISSKLGQSYSRLLEVVYQYSLSNGSEKTIHSTLLNLFDKVSKLLMRTQLVGEPLVSNVTFVNNVHRNNYPADLDGLAMTYSDDASQYNGFTVTLPESFSETLGAGPRSLISHKMAVTSIDDLEVSSSEYNNTIISPYVFSWALEDGYSISNLSDRIVYQIPLTQPMKTQKRTRSLVQSTEYSYSCRYVAEDGQIVLDSTCTISFTSNTEVAKCECSQPVSVIVVQSVREVKIQTDITCNNTLSTDPTVCNGHGNCTGLDICSCEIGFNGTYCEISNEASKPSTGNNGNNGNSTESNNSTTTNNGTDFSNTTTSSNSSSSTNDTTINNSTSFSNSSTTSNSTSDANNSTSNSNSTDNSTSSTNTTDTGSSNSTTVDSSNSTSLSNSSSISNTTSDANNSTSNSTDISTDTNSTSPTNSSNSSTSNSTSNSTNNSTNNQPNTNTTDSGNEFNSTSNNTSNSTSSNSNDTFVNPSQLLFQSNETIVNYCDKIILKSSIITSKVLTEPLEWVSEPQNSYLDSLLESLSDSQVELDSSQLETETWYQISLSTTIDNERISNTTFIFVKRGEIVIQSNQQDYVVSISGYTVISPNVNVPSCYPKSNLHFVYSNDDKTSVASVTNFATDSSGNLLIGKNSTKLSKAGYYFMSLSVSADKLSSATSYFKVKVTAEPLLVKFNVSDISVSYDEIVSFSIITKDPNSLEESESLDIKCFDEKNEKCNIAYPITRIYSTNLPAGKYQFIANYQKGSLAATSSLTVTVIDVPVSSIIPVSIVLGNSLVDPRNVDPNIDLTFTYQSSAFISANATFKWSSDLNLGLISTTNRFIVITSDLLPLNSNSHYVTLEVKDGSKYAKSTFTFSINTPPTIGTVIVSPSSGTSLQTVFSISIGDGWTDTNLPLSFQFLYLDESSASWKPISKRSTQQSITSKLPTGFTNGLLKVKVITFDSLNSYSEKEVSVTVKPMDHIDTQFMQELANSTIVPTASEACMQLDSLGKISTNSSMDEKTLQVIVSASSNIVEQYTSSIDVKEVKTENTEQIFSALSSASTCSYVSDSASSKVISKLEQVTSVCTTSSDINVDRKQLETVKSTADNYYVKVQESVSMARKSSAFSTNDLVSLNTIFTNIGKLSSKNSVPDMPGTLVIAKTGILFSRRINTMSIQDNLISGNYIDNTNTLVELKKSFASIISGYGLSNFTLLVKSQSRSKMYGKTGFISNVIELAIGEKSSDIVSTEPIGSISFQLDSITSENLTCFCLNKASSLFEKNSKCCSVVAPKSRSVQRFINFMQTGTIVLALDDGSTDVNTPIITPTNPETSVLVDNVPKGSDNRLLGLLALLAIGVIVIVLVIVLVVICVVCKKKRKKSLASSV